VRRALAVVGRVGRKPRQRDVALARVLGYLLERELEWGYRQRWSVSPLCRAGWRGIRQTSARGVCSISSLWGGEKSVDLGLEERAGGRRRGRADTFLAFVEDGRARVVGAGFLGVREFLATAFVDAFEGHCGWG
jgi:hypothetical protein